MKFANKKFSSNKDRSILNIGIDDCSKACNEELGFECKSFDFCYLNGDCRLNQREASILSPDDVLDSNECDIYESRNKNNNYKIIKFNNLKE